MIRRLATGACALALVAAVAVRPAHALDRGDIGTIGPDNPHLEFTGTPFAGVYPASSSPRQPFAGYRPPTCRTLTYCDSVEFSVKYPGNYLREVFFGVSITLSWDNPYHEDDNPAGNDLDLFLWGDDGPAAGGPASSCQSPGDDECDNIHPEVVSMTEPPDTTVEDANPPAIFLTIVNDRGVNTGYTLTVDWFEFELPPPPRFTPPERQTSAQPTVSGPFEFEVTTASEGVPTPAPTPRKILVPGPDGELREIELPVYAAGQRLGATAERSSTVPWVIATVAGALALAGSTFLLIRRNRRLSEE